MSLRSVLAKLKPGVGSERSPVTAAFVYGFKQQPRVRDYEDEERKQRLRSLCKDEDQYKKLMERLRANKRPMRFGRDVGYPHLQSIHSPKITAYASLAVQHFNKQKNSQLRFVRAVKASCQDTGRMVRWGAFYYLTLEAVDARVVKIYQAIVHDYSNGPWLYMFGLVNDNGNGDLLTLIDNSHLCPVDFRGLDSREVEPYCLMNKIVGPMQTEEGCFLKDEMLGSSNMLPLHQS